MCESGGTGILGGWFVTQPPRFSCCVGRTGALSLRCEAASARQTLRANLCGYEVRR
jgi:hypothetical protein